MKETALPSQLRRRAMAILMPTAILALGAAGCTSTGVGASSDVVAPAASVPQGASATAIVKAYQKYMNAYVAAYNSGNPNDPAFVQVGGGTGGGLQAVLQDSINAGVIANGKPEWSDPQVQFVDANKTIASVSFCFDPGTWKTIKADTAASPSPVPEAPPLLGNENPPHPKYPGDAIGKFRAFMLLDRDNAGNWTVQQTNAQPDNPC
jgi:hypothetical protein